MDGGTDSEKLKSSMTIAKAIAVITNKHSCEMVERHVRALNRIYSNNKSGFLLKELSDLCKLLTVCSERLHMFPEYIEPLSKLISICGVPFLKEKASDENTYAPQVIEILVLLGRLAKGSNDSLRAHTAKAVGSFYTGQPNLAHKEGLQMTRLTFNAALVERSAVAKSFTEALHLCEDDMVRLDLLETLQLLSTMPTNCNHMLSVGAAHVMCDILTIPHPEHRILFIGLEILWNLLEHGSQIQVAVQLSSLEGLSILKCVFHDLMVTSNSVQMKQMRNDVLMICCRVAQICPDAPFVETGFLRDLCVFATFPEETGSRLALSDSLKHLKFTQQHEDFELKKTLLSILTTLSCDGAAVMVMSREKVVRAMLSFVVTNDKAERTLWNTAQFEELQLLALSCLSNLAPQPLCIGDYMNCQGNTRVLLLIEWFTKDDGFKGCGNSFHGDGGGGSKLSQLRYSLRLLLSMCSTGDELVQQDLHEQGTIPLLLGLLKKFFMHSGPIEELSLLLEIQADILLIISCICETDMHRKELFAGYEGVKLVVGYLKRDIGKFSSGLGHHRLLLAATDCVWCTVVGSTIVEDIFLENEGMFVLLDVLKVCPANMQNLVLGVIVDLCENAKAIPHVGAWRASSDNSCVWSLLAKLWRTEEKDMDVPREVKNTLAGTEQPLMGAEQNACGIPPIPTHCPSAAIIDVTENMRAKIYALCCKMGFQFPTEELSTEDRITLCIIESYLDFKTGEVWYEVAGELAQEGLRPVTPDQECLTEILQTYEEKAEETLKLQHDLIDEQHKTEEVEEFQFYEKIKQLHLLKEKPEQDFKSFVERTSNYDTLKEAKRQQLATLDASRKSNVAIGDRFHSSDHHSLNITAFCGRNVSIATTPMKLLSGNVVPTSPRHQSQSPTSIPS